MAKALPERGNKIMSKAKEYISWLLARLPRSSKNPEKIALRIKTAMLGVFVLVAYVARVLGVEILQDDWTQFATLVSGAIVASLHIWAWVRKVLDDFSKI